MKIPADLKKSLRAMHYGIAGHAAVEICSWTKKHLRDEGCCYKRKFYGVDTNRCAQIAPTPLWCEHNCIYCWRPMEFMNLESTGTPMEPEDMVRGLVKERKTLLSGFKGSKLTNQKKFQDAYQLFPNHWAISLSGEPTLYEKLGELLALLKKNKEVRSIFVVSNGQEPEVLEKLAEEKSLPTQLYISVNAPNQKLYEEIAHPNHPGGWKKLKRSLSLLEKIVTRTVIRFTLIKGINDADGLIEQYARLFQSAQSDFIEVKAFMIIGYSRKRLRIENMPSFEEVGKFARKLEKELPDYRIIDEVGISRIVLLKKRRSKIEQIIIFNEPRYQKVEKITPEWSIYRILQKYRKARMWLDDNGFDSWDEDSLTLDEQVKKKKLEVSGIVEELNNFIRREYGN